MKVMSIDPAKCKACKVDAEVGTQYILARGEVYIIACPSCGRKAVGRDYYSTLATWKQVNI